MDRSKVDYRGCVVALGDGRRGLVLASEYLGMNGGAPDYRLGVEVRPGQPPIEVEMVKDGVQVEQWARGQGQVPRDRVRAGERASGRPWRRPAGARVRQGELL